MQNSAKSIEHQTEMESGQGFPIVFLIVCHFTPDYWCVLLAFLCVVVVVVAVILS